MGDRWKGLASKAIQTARKVRTSEAGRCYESVEDVRVRYNIPLGLTVVELTTVPRGVPRRWRGPPRAADRLESYEVVYLPVRRVESLSVESCVEVYDYEVEALRLVHLEGLTTEEAAARMGMSKATFWRVLESCRLKVAQALAERKPIKLVSTSPEDKEGESL